MENSSTQEAAVAPQFISPQQLLQHWQGHRRLTRRTIEAFPEEAFFMHTIGGMRPFAAIVMELIGMATPGMRGLVTGKWQKAEDVFKEQLMPKTKAEVLAMWDEATEEIDRLWAQLKPSRFQEIDEAFGEYKDHNYATLLYFIDNEVHHRGQGFVYLRSLGIAPPNFWER